MSRDAMLHQVQVRQGAYLPHWTQDGATYHVVFRLGDSLPASIVARYRAELESFRTATTKRGMSPEDQARQLHELFSERIESTLDQGLGACWLARQEIASLTTDALRFYEGKRYALHAWCIMPNHVHVVVHPLGSTALSGIIKSWKGYIAHEANRLLSRTGEFWQPEYYDHLIRSERELTDTIIYVQRNPITAGLKNWRWFWP